MAVLIVTKTTNYELHGPIVEAKVAQGRVGADVLERLLLAHSDHYRTLERLREALKRVGIAFDEVTRTSPSPWQPAYEALITVGGDGTLLAATHHLLAGGLVCGIRSSSSSVGYLCCAGPDDPELVAAAIKERTYHVEAIPRIAAEVMRVDSGAALQTSPVLNDFLYTNANPAATTRYLVRVGQAAETHRSSGVWVATGIGSTAAILAAGGQRRPATDPLGQYFVRELYRLDGSNPRLAGGVLDLDSEPLVIENRCVHALLALDGQHGVVDLAYGDIVRFRRASPIHLVRSLPRKTDG